MTTLSATSTSKLTRKDFVSDQEVRWCPGCGDYAILAQMQKVLPELGVPREKIVFISGIGCSSRLPYYLNTYGVHSIHGRAPTLATGLKMANPELLVWVITGDGDGLSIGGNHLLHALRRNVDIKIVLFNNRIYGLTKGQYSPTSLPGAKTKSSPMGTIEQSFNPLCVAIGAEATFVARTVDVDTRHLAETLRRAAAHRGTAFVEVYQNCLIFNDGAWQHATDAQVKDDNVLLLEHGKPMIFGKDRDKGIRLNGLDPEVVRLGNGAPPADLLVHDEHKPEASLAYLLSRMDQPAFPVPLGVFRDVDRPTYISGMLGQIQAAIKHKGDGDLRQLYFASETWVVTDREERRGEDRAEDLVGMGMSEEYLDDLGKDSLPDPTALQRSLAADPIAALHPPKPVCVGDDTSLAETVRLMRQGNFGCMLVCDSSGRLSGIFTERDLLTRVACQVEDLNAAKVSDYMTPGPSALKAGAPIAHALHLMALHGFRHVPLVDDDGRAQGIISFRDVVRYMQKYFGG